MTEFISLAYMQIFTCIFEKLKDNLSEEKIISRIFKAGDHFSFQW